MSNLKLTNSSFQSKTPPCTHSVKVFNSLWHTQSITLCLWSCSIRLVSSVRLWYAVNWQSNHNHCVICSTWVDHWFITSILRRMFHFGPELSKISPLSVSRPLGDSSSDPSNPAGHDLKKGFGFLIPAFVNLTLGGRFLIFWECVEHGGEHPLVSLHNIVRLPPSVRVEHDPTASGAHVAAVSHVERCICATSLSNSEEQPSISALQVCDRPQTHTYRESSLFQTVKGCHIIICSSRGLPKGLCLLEW